jgi:hypothetical protein
MSAKPRLMNLNAPTVRNQRTLVWLQQQAAKADWSKWDGVVTSLENYHTWSNRGAVIQGVIITDKPAQPDAFIQALLKASKDVTMILLSQSVMSVQPETFWVENFDNVLVLEDVLRYYPYLIQPWDGTNADAIAIFALLCRYHRVVDCFVSDERRAVCGADVAFVQNETPAQCWLITQFFQHSEEARFKEIKECLERNCACPHIDRIVLLNEEDLSRHWLKKGPNKGQFIMPGAQKIQQVIIKKRLTYYDFLKYVKESVPANTYTMLCNADIYCGDSLLDLWKIKMDDRMLALLRWDVDETGDAKIFGPRADSQDTWIFLSNSIQSRQWKKETFEFQLGQPGCDNAFGGYMLRQGFLLCNPAMTFKTYHLHQSNVRNYNKNDMIKTDLYINLIPTYIIDTKQETVPASKFQSICNELVSFEVKSSSLSNEITYCTMLDKEGRYKWEASVENHYFEPAVAVYNWKNACVSPNGLVYDLYRIYTGKHHDEDQFNYWSTANVSIFTAMQPQKQMIAVPFVNTEVFQHPDTYILHYFSRCMRLKKELYPDASFWIAKPFLPYLSYFDCDMSSWDCPIFDTQTACWANEVVGFLPGPSSSELGKEDIAVLRSMLPSWKQAPVETIYTVILDDILTSDFVYDRIVPFFLEKNEDYTVRVVAKDDFASYDAFISSALCITVGGKDTRDKWAKLWALPENACLVEFQQELAIDGECQHVAHVSGLRPWILLLSKGKKKDVQDQIMEQLEKWYKKNSFMIG